MHRQVKICKQNETCPESHLANLTPIQTHQHRCRSVANSIFSSVFLISDCLWTIHPVRTVYQRYLAFGRNKSADILFWEKTLAMYSWWAVHRSRFWWFQTAKHTFDVYFYKEMRGTYTDHLISSCIYAGPCIFIFLGGFMCASSNHLYPRCFNIYFPANHAVGF